MANLEHFDLMKQGKDEWNSKRPEFPDLKGADLRGGDLRFLNLRDADLSDAHLSNADLSAADLMGANLSCANLTDALLIDTMLIAANLIGTNLIGANLTDADLTGANLTMAKLRDANMSQAFFGGTTIGDTDISDVRGLDLVEHAFPSIIGIDTLYKSEGKIPSEFLRGCGVPDDFITLIPSVFGTQQAIQFYSCFISYSTKDEDFAKRLYSRMRDAHLRVWFAPEDMKAGEKLYEQVERAIHVHDRLLLVLSESSIQSEWVMTEIRNARNAEIEQTRRKLFPITLVDFQTLKRWKCFDADHGKDLAVEVREYFIPDFSNWKDHDSFEKAFTRLLNDLQKSSSP